MAFRSFMALPRHERCEQRFPMSKFLQEQVMRKGDFSGEGLFFGRSVDERRTVLLDLQVNSFQRFTRCDCIVEALLGNPQASHAFFEKILVQIP